jgi:hypothetical protein
VKQQEGFVISPEKVLYLDQRTEQEEAQQLEEDQEKAALEEQEEASFDEFDEDEHRFSSEEEGPSVVSSGELSPLSASMSSTASVMTRIANTCPTSHKTTYRSGQEITSSSWPALNEGPSVSTLQATAQSARLWQGFRTKPLNRQIEPQKASSVNIDFGDFTKRV